MTCKICCSAPHVAGRTEFLTGCGTFKKETLQKHNIGGGHLCARDAVLANQKPVENSTIAQSFQKGEKASKEKHQKDGEAKINTAYFIAKEELSFSKFEPILALQRKNGLEISLTYRNDKGCNNFVSLVSSVITEQLASEINGKRYVSVMIDSATDASGKENETVHCRFVKDGVPTNRLVGHKEVAHAHAQGILDTVNGAFQVSGIHLWKGKLAGMGADGASVNLGKKGGVVALLRQDVPHLLHRLELALLEMQRSCKLLETVHGVLQLIWKTYHYSPKSTRELQTMGSELGVNVLKPTQVSGTRWLPHISRALKVMIEPGKEGSGQYAAVLSHMDHLSAASKNADVKGRAKYVAEKMRSIQFSAFCHFLACSIS
ncbi:zinc finger protein 862-like [Montipora foliosa]|uniref:zinc finger protein 862-like n=1 Tax=Montipora foliosa TaxID=591990 RepID=UPI0035F1D7F5